VPWSLSAFFSLLLITGSALAASGAPGRAAGKTTGAVDTSKAGDKYSGVFRADLDRSKDTVRIKRIKDNEYSCRFDGYYPGLVGDNTGQADCTGKIENDLGIFKQKNWRAAALCIQFKGDSIIVVQQGDESDCGFGHNVNATGIYSQHRQKSWRKNLHNTANNGSAAHFEDGNGKLACAGTFDSPTPFRENMAIVRGKELNGFIDRRGKLVVPYKFGDCHDFFQGLAAASLDRKKWGYINKSGQFVIKPVYDYAWDFSEGAAAVGLDGKQYLIDRQGTRFSAQNWQHVLAPSEGLSSFQEGSLWGVIDVNGNIVVPAKYSSPLHFQDGLADFTNSFGKHGYIDKSGKEVISPYFDEADPFYEGLAAVKENGLWSFIDKSGEARIKPQFSDHFGGFVSGRCFVRYKRSPFISIIDKSGNRLKNLPLQCRDLSTTAYGVALEEGAAIAHILDWGFDSNGRNVPVDNEGNILKGFANKNVEYWKGEGFFVVDGPAPAK